MGKKKDSKIQIWGWDKKPRTMRRYLKRGDIFCFRYDDSRYCFYKYWKANGWIDNARPWR